MSRKQDGAEVVNKAFGGSLYQQGRGFYAALELIAILRGECLLEERDPDCKGCLLPPPGLPARYLRPSHDFARRLMVGDPEVSDHQRIRDGATERTLRALLRAVEMPIPGARRRPANWGARHFFPFPAELVHYDAVYRRGKVSTERYVFRGAGGLAHRILRLDPDSRRLTETREALRNLFGPSGSDMGRIALALQELDDQQMDSVFEDDVEGRSWPEGVGRETRWFELLREGLHRVVTRADITDFRRVETFIVLVPFCLAMHQLTMARRVVQVDEASPVVVDACHGPSPVRETAKADLSSAVNVIDAALREVARRRGHEHLLTGSSTWRKGPRSFFTTTLFAVGILNANTGKRFFAARPAFLDMVCTAFLSKEVSFQYFSRDLLHRRLGLITDDASTDERTDLDLDRQHLDDNATCLAERLAGLGLLREYSDATRMVGVQP